MTKAEQDVLAELEDAAYNMELHSGYCPLTIEGVQSMYNARKRCKDAREAAICLLAKEPHD